MKDKIYTLLIQKNIDITKYNIERLYQAGLNKIIDNIEFYYDKPYSCESVFKELFDRGVMEEIRKVQSV